MMGCSSVEDTLECLTRITLSPEASDQQRQDAARVKKNLLQVINKDKKGSK